MTETHNIDYEVYTSSDALPGPDRELARLAREACTHAHAPYSGFRVGAAARLRGGAIITGSNQESEVFPAGMCAERVLLFGWQAHHAADPIETIAIASAPSARECYPCGACRQTLVDAERRQGSPIRIVMCSDTTATAVRSAADLLPFAFKL